MANGKVLKKISMLGHLKDEGREADFTNDVYLLTFTSGFQAVFKPKIDDEMGDAAAELFAYRFAKLLGFPFVPATIIRQIDGQIGSLQQFITSELDLLKSDNFQKAFSKVSPDDFNKLKLFYFISGQWDYGKHNLLFTESKNGPTFVAIDNEGIKNAKFVESYGKLPFVRVFYSEKFHSKEDEWGSDASFPFESAKIIENLSEQALRAEFGNILSQDFIDNTTQSNEAGKFKYVIFRNALWRQFHYEDESMSVFYSKTESCSEDTLSKIKLINEDSIKELLIDIGHYFLNEAFVNNFTNGIMERRAMVLEHLTSSYDDEIKDLAALGDLSEKLMDCSE